jgi:hypothetical protein
MKKVFGLVLVSILFFSCKKTNVNKYENFYEVLDEVLRFTYYDADFVVRDLINTNWNSVVTIDQKEDTLKNIPPPPPPPGFTAVYDKTFFISLYNDNLIDSIDIEFMYSQIDTLKKMVLDSTRLIKPLLSRSFVDTLFKTYGIDSAYEILHTKYKCHSFLKISTPLISKDGNKMLFDIDNFCGGLCGSGMTYLFGKKNKKWKIIYTSSNWIS